MSFIWSGLIVSSVLYRHYPAMRCYYEVLELEASCDADAVGAIIVLLLLFD